MSKAKILSGFELVGKGFTKIETTLPEVGLKDVQPNGSWLEQKQIQSAIEARKHLIEVERIEKSGVLSIAVWDKDEMLAEVTQKVGGHWQFLGHNVGSRLYLYPEEALYLMEVNCLQLIYNDMKVSLQQAYILLLKGKVTILQYKVYSSLSRLGYRLFRHKKIKVTEYEKKIRLSSNCSKDDNIDVQKCKSSEEEENNLSNKSSECLQETIDVPTISTVKSSNTVADTELVKAHEMREMLSTNTKKQRNSYIYQRNVEKLRCKKIKACNNEVIHKCFNDIPSLLGKQTVCIKAPDKQYIPKYINVNKNTYDINLVNIQKKIASPALSDSNIYSHNDEANGSHIRRLRTSSTQLNYSLATPVMSFPTQNMQFRFINYWRPAQTMNFNVLFQRPYLPRRYGPQFMPHLGSHIRYFFNNQQFFGNQFVNNYNYSQTPTNLQSRNYRRTHRSGVAQNDHLEAIRRLATRLKELFLSSNTSNQNIESLQSLIHSYNVRYKARIRLTRDFEIENEQNIVDTIILEDDDEPQRKKRRSNDIDEAFEQSLNLLKNLAEQLKEIEQKGLSTSKHRRAFTKALRSFNSTYDVEYYVNNEFVLINSRHITVASTSDSDCQMEEVKSQINSRHITVVSTSDSDCQMEEAKSQKRKRKKLKNPFNVMKRLSETQNEVISEVHSCASGNNENVIGRDKKYSQEIRDVFSKNWLPSEDDFGRAEILKNDTDSLMDNKHEEFLYDFFTVQQNKFDNWLDLKLSFYRSLEKAVVEFQHITTKEDTEQPSSKLDDSVEIKTLNDKLKMIKSATTIDRESNLIIDFDVYNRNVQNFKKSKPPVPHFRLICLDELAAIPSGEEIAALNSEYDDDVTVVFAVVGVSSISYVRMNPVDLPVYVPSNTKQRI